MEMKFGVILFVFLLCLVHINGLPAPRDNTLIKSDELIVNKEAFVPKEQDKPYSESTNSNEVRIPGRVGCQYGGEEPIEDEDCQRHCIPKGFTYGLCFNNVCSCA